MFKRGKVCIKEMGLGHWTKEEGLGQKGWGLNKRGGTWTKEEGLGQKRRGLDKRGWAWTKVEGLSENCQALKKEARLQKVVLLQKKWD